MSDERCTELVVLGEQRRRCQLEGGHDGACRWLRNRPRRSRPRSKTIAAKKITRAALGAFDTRGHALELSMERPRRRTDCINGGMNCERPCPFVTCKHHLYLDVDPETGSLKLNFPDLEPWELRDTCALDVAERGGATLEDVGQILNLTRERIRQLEVRGLLKLKRDGALADA